MAEIVVIGGGAAGMMAALQAARSGAEVTLLERNEKLGKKIYITGKGRCNLTNDCTQDEFLQQVPRNPRFLYSALSAFSPQDMMALMEQGGCEVVVQRGRRVFPATEKASDVTRTLARLMQQFGVHVRLNARVSAIVQQSGALTGVQLESGEMLHRRWVPACRSPWPHHHPTVARSVRPGNQRGLAPAAAGTQPQKRNADPSQGQKGALSGTW